MTLLHYADADARHFAGWKMGSVDLDKVNRSIVLRFSHGSAMDPYSMTSGGALAMRPLLLHSSKRTVTTGHRRIVHLEFSADPLPKPLEFAAGARVASE